MTVKNGLEWRYLEIIGSSVSGIQIFDFTAAIEIYKRDARRNKRELSWYRERITHQFIFRSVRYILHDESGLPDKQLLQIIELSHDKRLRRVDLNDCD